MTITDITIDGLTGSANNIYDIVVNPDVLSGWTFSSSDGQLQRRAERHRLLRAGCRGGWMGRLMVEYGSYRDSTPSSVLHENNVNIWKLCFILLLNALFV